jgi:N-methylhydantoinase A
MPSDQQFTGNPASHYRVGADIGGTFTDIVLVAPDGSYGSRKVLSTTDDYSRGIVEALLHLAGELDVPVTDVDEIVHGTTIATNAILENKGAKTALITTRGFRDVLELRRLRTPQLYDRYYEPPKPVVERRLRLEVTERLDASGEVVVELDESSIHTALDHIECESVEAIAVSLLHSYRHPAHERRVGALVHKRFPGVFLSLSVDVLPEIREYERTSTTVLNAYVGPVVRDYLGSLERRLQSAEINANLLIMQSNGGVMSAVAASEKPSHIVESGPAAGVIAAQSVGERAGFRDVISFDMGGTTAKASLIENGQLACTTEYEVGAGISLSSRLVKGGGHALKLPVIDIAEVGAGGGSIVWIDRAGALKVGPQSAGAMPGPVCHDTGGTEPTITDANLLLGYVNPSGLAGGAIPVRKDLAETAIEDRVAGPLGLSRLEAAYGVFTVANITMIRAIKAVSTYRGRDPRDFALLAFGGNGPIHSAGIARELGMRSVIVPPVPGLLSAGGLLAARLERHYAQTLFGRLDAVGLDRIEQAYTDLETRATNELASEQTDTSAIDFHRSADLRYAGQGFELTVDTPPGSISEAWLAGLLDAFGDEHERTYGHKATSEPVELVNIRLIAHTGQQAAMPVRPIASGQGTARRDRQIYFGAGFGLVSAAVIDRNELTSTRVAGPFVIEEYDSTTIVPPDATVRLDPFNNIVIDLAAASEALSPHA